MSSVVSTVWCRSRLVPATTLTSEGSAATVHVVLVVHRLPPSPGGARPPGQATLSPTRRWSSKSARPAAGSLLFRLLPVILAVEAAVVSIPWRCDVASLDLTEDLVHVSPGRLLLEVVDHGVQ